VGVVERIRRLSQLGVEMRLRLLHDDGNADIRDKVKLALSQLQSA
jgi:hypothetical protein